MEIRLPDPDGAMDRVLHFAIPTGAIIAATTFAAFAMARVSGLPLVRQRTAATLVAMILSLCVLLRLAIPLTGVRLTLVAAMVAGFASLFPAAAVRHFYELPAGQLGITLLIAVSGATAPASFWIITHRRHDRSPVPRPGSNRR